MRRAAAMALMWTAAACGQADPACAFVQVAVRAVRAARLDAAPDLREADAACSSGAARERIAALNLTPGRLLAWINPALARLTGQERFDLLPAAAKAAFRAGEWDQAQQYARELLQMAPEYSKDRTYGDAIYDGYSVMGRVAVHNDNVALATRYLMNAATTPGSAALAQDGPDMTLARDLLEKGQAVAVLQFFTRCREFWKNENGRLAAWSDTIQRHRMPDFGASLTY